ncbi:uncharacterized protein LOC110689330 isoform X2 [Chenopodium quinoa]|uniref:uncharacterized protein LOC110689330 isoform X2 n=1 Tax=Chenopodium quinoa TaxID=63459 RepID=UPI000B773D6E|nr:uncharacterized protein LOC110689330 isoform X2 [Chenopodium quinoa]
MGKKHSVRFQIGQLAEARTFVSGFRGAWFRCKIKKSTTRKGRITAYVVEYYDYPEEADETVDLYRLPPESSNGHKAKKELMLRPQFPAFYRESELPDVNVTSEVIVAVADVRRVGDLVDWLTDGCYWSGTITEIIDNDTVQIKLLEPPRGEGSSYTVNCKDLRPSLDWSPESGWTVPVPLETQNGQLHARLIQPLKQARTSKCLFDVLNEDKQNVKVTPRSIHSKDSLKQREDTPKKAMEQTHEVNAELDIRGSTIGKHSCSDGVSSTYVRDVSAEAPVATSDEEQYHEKGSAKKMRLNETITLNSTGCDDIESIILDLEELVNRVKWLKQMLKFGIPSTPQGPTWEHMERPAVSTRK